MNTEVLDRPAAGQTQEIAERPKDQQPMPLTVVQYAVQSGAPIAEVRALLELQVAADNHQLALLKERRVMDKEDQATAALLAYREAFARFKSLNVVVPKSKTVTQKSKTGGPGPSFKQSEMDVIAKILQPALAGCGFSYRFDVKFQRSAEGGVAWCSVTCYLEHSGGHFESVTLEGPPDDSGAKNPLQEMQSSSTFLQRHCVLAITGTAQSGTDNDGRGARGTRDDGEPWQEPKVMWVGKAVLARDVDELTAISKAGAKYFIGVGDRVGYALFKTAVQARGAEIKGGVKPGQVDDSFVSDMNAAEGNTHG